MDCEWIPREFEVNCFSVSYSFFFLFWIIIVATVANTRNVGIDSLRVFGLMYVVGFWHLCEYTPVLSFVRENRFMPVVTVWVLAIFVYLSGYLISTRYRFETRAEVFTFYRKRLMALYPMYLVSVFGFYFAKLIDLGGVIKSIFLFSVLANKGSPTLWFAEMLMVFYLITPCFLSISNWKHLSLAVVVGVALILLHLCFDMIDVRLIYYFAIYQLGLLSAKSSEIQRLSGRPLVVWLLFALSCICLYCFEFLHETCEGLLMGIAAFSFIPFAMSLTPFLGKHLPSRAVTILAYSGYNAYLLHRLTYKAGLILFRSDNSMVTFLILVCLLLPGTIALGYVTQLFVDRYIIKGKVPS